MFFIFRKYYKSSFPQFGIAPPGGGCKDPVYYAWGEVSLGPYWVIWWCKKPVFTDLGSNLFQNPAGWSLL